MARIAKLGLTRTSREYLPTFGTCPLQRNIRQSARCNKIRVLFPERVICSGVARVAKCHKVFKSVRFSVIIVQVKRPDMMHIKVDACNPAFLACMAIALQRITPLARPIRAAIGDVSALPIRAIFSTVRCRRAPRIGTLAAAECMVACMASLTRCWSPTLKASDHDASNGVSTCPAAVVILRSLCSIALFLKRFAAGSTHNLNTLDLGCSVAFSTAERLPADVETCATLVVDATMGANKIAHIRHYTAKYYNFQVNINTSAQLPIVYGKITPRSNEQTQLFDVAA